MYVVIRNINYFVPATGTTTAIRGSMGNCGHRWKKDHIGDRIGVGTLNV